jgi:tRNA pseudouridine38-40 synthase
MSSAALPMKLRLVIAYDGTDFQGFQSQSHGCTVQDTLEAVLGRIVGERVIIHGSGRTDAGVHALGQTVHFELTPEQAGRLGRMEEPGRWMAALNSWFPPSLRVMRVTRAAEKFHARFSASGKIYRYDLWHAPVLPPHLHKRAWHLYGKLDYELIRQLCALIEGAHDFRGFCADSGSLPAETVRTLHRVKLRVSGPSLSITLQGDGFLYRMVRMLVGAMVRVAQGKETLGEFQARLAAGKPWPTPAMAPAEGLYLVKAIYGKRRGGNAALLYQSPD